MRQCDKRQRVVKRGRDGSSLELFRCLNNECGFSGQEVDLDICSRCPVAVILKKEPPCKKPKAPPPIYTPEIINVTAEDVKKMLAEEGLDDSDVDYEPYKDEMGPLPPNYPPLSMQLWTYKEAVIRWNKAGRPVRSDEEVKQIHDEHCKKCEWYDPDQKRCRGCGCKVTVSSIALVNKIKMETEHCPKDKW